MNIMYKFSIIGILLITIMVIFSGCVSTNPQNEFTASPSPLPTQSSSDKISTGVLSGYVMDRNLNRVSSARVTLWQNGEIVDVQDNPHIMNGYTDNYSFKVPYGVYTISAEKHDASGKLHSWATKVIVDNTMVDSVIAIPDLVISIPSGSSAKVDSWTEPPIYNSDFDNPAFSILLGIASYADSTSIPMSAVYLYQSDGKLYASPENPQSTVSRPEVAPLGTFRFFRVPFGQYTVTVKTPAWSGHIASEASVSVNVAKGVEFVNIAIP